MYSFQIIASLIPEPCPLIIESVVAEREVESEIAKCELIFGAPLPRRKRLEWAIHLAEQSPKTITPGDWENFRHEISAFCQEAGPTWAPRVGETVALPSEDEARSIHKALGEMIANAVQRKPTSLGMYARGDDLFWNEWQGRFSLGSSGEGWHRQAMNTLAHLLVEFGHLVRECPALKPRGEEGETCGTWFVANRPRQTFCSPRCQSRATTKAYRQSAKTVRRSEKGAAMARPQKISRPIPKKQGNRRTGGKNP
jgi:hypothetical protein